MTLFDAATGTQSTSIRWLHAAAVATSSLLLVASAKLQVPFYPVPMTMQTLVVVGIGLALGPTRGASAVLLYLAMGLVGLPVFAGTPEKGIGLAYMLGPTGGYVVGYLIAVLIAGWLSNRGWDRHHAMAAADAIIATASVYLPGLLWLGAVVGWEKPLLAWGLFPFILGDVLKALIASIAFPAAWRLLNSRGLR